MNILKVSTATTIQVGPFVDSADGVTPETGLSLTVQVSKAGGTFADRNSATAITYDAHGFYRVELDTTDTGTLGRFVVAASPAGAVPVWHEFTVVPAAVYDALVGSGALSVNVATIDNTAVDSILDRAITEPEEVFSWASASLRNIIGWIGALSRNKITQTATTQTLRNDADDADIATSTHADDGTTHTRGEFS